MFQSCCFVSAHCRGLIRLVLEVSHLVVEKIILTTSQVMILDPDNPGCTMLCWGDETNPSFLSVVFLDLGP